MMSVPEVATADGNQMPASVAWNPKSLTYKEVRDTSGSGGAAFVAYLSLKLAERGLYQAPPVRSSGNGVKDSKFPLANLDAIYTTPDLSQTIFLKLGVLPSDPTVFNHVLDLPSGSLFHGKTSDGVPYAILFSGISRGDTGSVLHEIRDFSAIAVHRWSLKSLVRAVESVGIRSAYAADCVNLPSNEPSPLINQGLSVVSSVIHNPVAQGSYRCVVGALKGSWDATGGMVVEVGKHGVSAAKASYRVVAGFSGSVSGAWDEVSGAWSKVRNFYSNFRQITTKVYKNFENLNPQMKAEIICRVISTVVASFAVGAAVSALSAGAAGPMMAAAIANALSKLEMVPEFASALRFAKGAISGAAESVGQAGTTSIGSLATEGASAQKTLGLTMRTTKAIEDASVPAGQKASKVSVSRKEVGGALPQIRYEGLSTVGDVRNAIAPSGEKIITLGGLSQHADKADLLSLVRRELAKIPAKQRSGYVVNMRGTPDGIGEAYTVAKKMGFKTAGIISSQGRDLLGLKATRNIDTLVIVKDSAWGGARSGASVSSFDDLTPTSKAVVGVSDQMLYVGSGEASGAELHVASELGIPVELVQAGAVSF